jgi:hypothetical protein
MHTYLLDITRTGEIVGLAVAIASLLAVVAGWLRWVRPRWRRATAQVVGVRDAILGREALVDTITGVQRVPALPGVGVRLANTEEAIEKLTELVERQGDYGARIEALEVRLTAIEESTIERIAGKAEMVELLRTIQAAQHAPPPAADPEELPDLH